MGHVTVQGLHRGLRVETVLETFFVQKFRPCKKGTVSKSLQAMKLFIKIALKDTVSSISPRKETLVSGQEVMDIATTALPNRDLRIQNAVKNGTCFDCYRS